MKIKKYLSLGAACAAALAFLLALALPALKVDGFSLSGWEVVFPAEVMALIMTMPFLTIALTAAGGVLSLYVCLHAEKKTVAYVATGCLVLAGIFFFCWKAFYCNAVFQEGAKEEMEYFKLGVGCILGGIFTLLGGAATVVAAVLPEENQ